MQRIYCFGINHYPSLVSRVWQLAQKKDLLEVEIRDLAIGIEDIKNEQEYTMARERTHRNSKYARIFIYCSCGWNRLNKQDAKESV